jgi:large subunit ribosomal protein L24
MKKEFSASWIGSKQPRKQRKYRFSAPLHVKKLFVHAHLSKELRTKYNRRAIGLKEGDRVKIMRGQFKGKTEKVERVDVKKSRIYVVGVEIIKKDGSKTKFPIDPSNVLITELNIDDKKRQAILDRKKVDKK